MMSVLPVLTFMVKACIVVLLLLLARGIAWVINLFLLAPLFDPLRKMPGPNASVLTSHFGDVMNPQNSLNTHEEWVKTYGKNFRFHGFGGHDYRLMTLDFRSVSYILNSPLYEKPWQTRSFISKLLGRGIFAMEGQEHKIQRRIIGPAFTTQAVKGVAPIFFRKAEELRDLWDASLPDDFSKDFSSSLTSPISATETTLDVAHWISRATFDVIGLAGFDYQFCSLQDESEEVYLAYRQMFGIADKSPQLRGLLQIYFPFIERVLPDEAARTTSRCLRVIRGAGRRLVEEKKSAILAEKSNASEIQEKDILSLLIKSNLASDPSKRLTDAELLDQLSSFLFAGSDSTALSVSWCIHLLSLNPELQTRLRDEILSLPANSSPYSDSSRASSPTPSETQSCASFSSFESAGGYSEYARADAIEALPFLDAVVRETLRVCPPVHGTIRCATKDDTIPISSPIDLRDGTKIDTTNGIRIRKGTFVHIPIEGLNMSKDIWGEDAREFNPDRWMDLPESARPPTHPGLANLMTFSFGPHSCPGWKFSILEMKLFLATLLPHFVFTPAEDIRKYNAILTRPYVSDQYEHGSKLPVKVGRYYGA
jgi:cytochrome P450